MCKLWSSVHSSQFTVLSSQFIDSYETKDYSDDVKRTCLKMYVNGLGFRGIERVTGVSRTTIMDWVKQVGKLLPDSYNPETIPEVGELDELEIFVGQKKNKIWLWTAVDHFRDGIGSISFMQVSNYTCP